MTSDNISLGQFQIHGIRSGFFYLDGGAMFGVVPKTLWAKKFPADLKNRIKLGLNCLLVKTQKELILIETGPGANLDPKFYEFYEIETAPGLLASLERLGHRPENVDIVINTHLHFDHCGGNTHRNKAGDYVPTFPEARYIIQEGEWEYALYPSERDKDSYLPESFIPLEQFGLVGLVNGDSKVSEGVEVFLSPGHTSHHQSVKISSEENVLFFLGDLVPTSAHIGLPYIMSYDLFPMETMASKRKFFEQAIEEEWMLAFVHDPHYFFGRVVKKEDKFHFQPPSS